MRIRTKSKFILYASVFANLGVLAFSMRRPRKQDWLVAYLFNAITNVIIDKVLVRNKKLEYPVRFFPKLFRINLAFDILVYPTITVVYNQWTSNDKSKVKIFAKVLCFAIPFSIIEGWFHRSTQLVKWQNGYKWYHTFLGVTSKSLVTRYAVGLFRKLVGGPSS